MDLTVEIVHGKLNIRVAAWIEQEGELLCATFPSGHISLPGGRVKFGETTMQAIKREVYEETGEHFRAPRLFAIIENFFEMNGQLFHEFLYIYKGEVPAKAHYFTQSPDEKIHWLPLSELHRLAPAVLKDLEKTQHNEVIHLVQRDEL